MIQEVGVRELKNQASEIVRSVRELHTEYVITYHGQPVARLTPIAASQAAGLDKHASKIGAEGSDSIFKGHSTDDMARLRPQNRLAIQILHEWLADETTTDEKLLDQFDAELQNDRIIFHSNLRHFQPLTLHLPLTIEDWLTNS